MDLCPCGSSAVYTSCCQPLIKGEQSAKTAEQLTRSRYSAYVKKEIEYVFTSLHPDHRSGFDEKSTRAWAENSQWHGFEIIKTTGGGPEDNEGRIEFIATYTEQGIKKEHHELSTFRKKDGTWYFADGKAMPPKPVVHATPKTGRNDPCPCGSGRKFRNAALNDVGRFR